MFYRIVVAGQKKGLVLGKNRTEKAAQGCVKKDEKNHFLKFGELAIYETQEELEIDSVDIEAAEQFNFLKRQEIGLYLMLELLGLQQNDEEDTRFICERITLHDWTLESLEEEFLEQAKEVLLEREEKAQREAEHHARIVATQTDLNEQRAEFTYTFPAVAGVQAGKQYFVAQVPYKALIRLFSFDDEFIPAELRAQRQLNEPRAKKIGQYITDNVHDYVLPALTASCDTSMFFEPASGVAGAGGKLGLLHISLDAILLINDGQHRRRGIEFALQENRLLAEETIAVTLYFDQGLKKSQQMFSDINTNQIKPSSAINTLYNHRNEYSAWILELLDLMPNIKFKTEMEASTVGKKSLKIWSIVALKKSISILTGYTEKNFVSATDESKAEAKNLVLGFFDTLSEYLPNWGEMVQGRLLAAEVRETMVVGHAVFLEALCMIGRIVVNQDGDLLGESLKALKNIDVSKSAQCWHGRCIVMGRMNKTNSGVKSTAMYLCSQLKISIPPELKEFKKEDPARSFMAIATDLAQATKK